MKIFIVTIINGTKYIGIIGDSNGGEFIVLHRPMEILMTINDDNYGQVYFQNGNPLGKEDFLLLKHKHILTCVEACDNVAECYKNLKCQDLSEVASSCDASNSQEETPKNNEGKSALTESKKKIFHEYLKSVGIKVH